MILKPGEQVIPAASFAAGAEEAQVRASMFPQSQSCAVAEQHFGVHLVPTLDTQLIKHKPNE